MPEGELSEDWVEAVPNAGAMIESLRAVGYSPQTAIADLIDNCIAAHATKVDIVFWWDGSASWVSVSDNGDGMGPAGLTEAMRPGTTGPLEERRPEDLGRFGLGLKTASFSQCRRLIVVSKPDDGSVSARCWDLDFVASTNRWRLLTKLSDESWNHVDRSLPESHGTVVLWECLDRMVGDCHVDNFKAHNRFLEMVDLVESHLGMVFHRYLAGASPRLTITIDCGSGPRVVAPWDPFMESHPATFCTPEESESLGAGKITLRGYVLPHKSKLSDDEHRLAGGPEGWNARQGFYIYRNNRLVVAGSWLGLGQDRPWTREEHYKLARLRLDIPNTMDLLWHLDVKKSDARPPGEIREWLKSRALVVRSQAKNVFSHRGAIGPRNKGHELPPVWRSVTLDGHPAYRVDRGHPLVQRVKATCSDSSGLKALLSMLEETVPVQRIWLDMAEQPDMPAGPYEFTPDDEVLEVAKALFVAMIENQGLTVEQARDRMRGLEVFGAIADTLTLDGEVA